MKIVNPSRSRASVISPRSIRASFCVTDSESTGTYRRDYRGQYVAVTSLERTLVDCFDRIDLGGGIEEIWRSLATITYLKSMTSSTI